MNSKAPGHAPRRCLIGLTPDFHEAAGNATSGHYELKQAYADAVFRAGGLPLVLPYSDDLSCVHSYLDRLSGLVVTGGAFDVPPEDYGEVPREGVGVRKEGRTRFESALLRGALARNMPVLGICGGMQLLNVVTGGTLFQDIGREVKQAKSHEQVHDRSQPQHPIEVKKGTALAHAVGHGALMVNSTHHQAVNVVGQKVVVSATAPDGIIEAIEVTGHPFAVGVQWHPELMVESVPANFGIYRAFVHRARDYHGPRRHT